MITSPDGATPDARRRNSAVTAEQGSRHYRRLSETLHRRYAFGDRLRGTFVLRNGRYVARNGSWLRYSRKERYEAGMDALRRGTNRLRRRWAVFKTRPV